jgi:hypothetical protein
MLSTGLATAEGEKTELSFSADVAASSKYIWRGQRLTDGWSLQPAGTLGMGNLSVNVWGTLDLVSVNEGDALFIKENPAAPPGDNNGLQGHFSEVDYTFSYSVPLDRLGIDFGSIVYTFPERSASLPATVEVFTGISFDTLPLSPSATLYVDVDESGKGSGSPGVYFLAAASHMLTFGHPRLPGLELSGSAGIVNRGFGEFYYGASHAGLHDLSFSVNLPINLGEHLSASAFVTGTALVGEFRDYQFLSARDVYRGTAGTPAGAADSVYGGMKLSLGF